MFKRIPLGVLMMFALFVPTPGIARTVGQHSRPAHVRPNRTTHTPTVHQRTPLMHDREPHAKPTTWKGLSTWYGPEMKVNGHYRRMANGQVFDPHQFTAASRTLPLGTMIEVTNLRTGLTVDVKITDRGPFTKGRILDLAEAAAKQIECNGVCPVEIAELHSEEVTP